MLGLDKKEVAILKKLNTPQKIQDFINKIPHNYETKGETCMSPREVLKNKYAHCIEGAMLSATALWINGKDPLVVHLLTIEDEQDHVIAVFKENGYWGAISKSNHSLLRYRDPVYKNIRELVMSYFNEYYIFDAKKNNGKKSLIGYTNPINLKRFGNGWITSDKNLWEINDFLFHSPHISIAPKNILKKLRPADSIEMKITKITNW